MSDRIKDFQQIKDYCSNFDSFYIYDYLYYIGITNVEENISSEDLDFLIDKCSQLGGEYTDPIEVGQSIASSVFNGDVSLEQLKKLSVDDFYDWYNNGRELGNELKIESEEEKEYE